MDLIKTISLKKLANNFSYLIYKHFKIPKRNIHKNYFRSPSSSQFGFDSFPQLRHRPDLEDQTLIFHVEKSLLKSSSLFPYFMLVAFEAGSLIRALILFVLYPFISLFCSEDFALKVMVMVSFFGVIKDGFREGRSVLPKYFLEDVGMESFEVMKRGKKVVGFSDLPRVMVESFLKEYLDVDFVVGRELKVFCGFYVGLMEEKREFEVVDSFDNAIGITGFKKPLDCPLLLNCKEIYLVSEKERMNWSQLPRNLYPKPLIFHDGRLAFRPTFLDSLAMFMWLPMGLFLAIFRIIAVLFLPYKIKCPLLHFTGTYLRIHKPENINVTPSKQKGTLYVCNHKTLLDPLALSYCLNTPLTAVTYSLSRITELLSPIRTVRLTRNREKDAELMNKCLSKGDLVVCPEGTTCREGYLLRFSPLFSEISESISPVAMDCRVGMFYGTSTGNFKCLDPLFFLMNPRPNYSIVFLPTVRGGADNCGDDDVEKSRFKIANLVQDEIAKELGFSCTKLTRKDKYLMLAGNEGTV